MKKLNRNVTAALIAVALVIAAVVTWLVVGSNRNGGDSASDQAGSSTSSAQSGQQPGENLPGAMVGNTQRSWPDPQGRFDDTPHATPGTYSADWMKQRPVWTPRNHDGDLPSRESLREGMEDCDKGTVTLQGKTQQQYVNARYLVVNEAAGPSRLDKGVPRGYAHSPQGAVVAAMNVFGYGFPAQGDEIGQEIDKAYWSTSASVQDELKFQGKSSEWGLKNSRARLIPSADAFAVKECSPNVVVVEVAFIEPDSLKGTAASQGDSVARVPMFWRNNDWQPDFSGSGDKLMDATGADLNQFTKVVYQ